MTSLFFAVVMFACTPPRGGWDLAALVQAEPELAGLNGHRLADMLPFPAFEGEQIALVACRFPSGRAIRLVGEGPGWSEDWARAAITSMNRGLRRLELNLEIASGPESDRPAEIHVVSMDVAGGPGPSGLADTLSECDVSRDSAAGGNHRGVLVGSEIRMRRVRLDMIDESLEVSGEEWIGAFMHEVAHALGFAGHAAAGRTILVREESRLRAAGRRALAGEPWRDETLEALYLLRPGQRLGSRQLSRDGLSWLREIRQWLERELSGGDGSVELRSSVGDRAARIRWRLADGRQLAVRLPNWSHELRKGFPITLVPDEATRRLLAHDTPSSDSLADRGV